MNRFMSFMAGALCGAVVGSVAALLLAPMSGQELQSRTREQVDYVVDEARSAAQAKRDELEKQLDTLMGPNKSVIEIGSPTA